MFHEASNQLSIVIASHIYLCTILVVPLQLVANMPLSISVQKLKDCAASVQPSSIFFFFISQANISALCTLYTLQVIFDCQAQIA